MGVWVDEQTGFSGLILHRLPVQPLSFLEFPSQCLLYLHRCCGRKSGAGSGVPSVLYREWYTGSWRKGRLTEECYKKQK